MPCGLSTGRRAGWMRLAGEVKTKRPPVKDAGDRFERENLMSDYFCVCASVRRFTIIPEKRTM